jgi:hypothetical protein
MYESLYAWAQGCAKPLKKRGLVFWGIEGTQHVAGECSIIGGFVWEQASRNTQKSVLEVFAVYEKHRAFQPPQDEDTKVWRYTDFTKFVSLLDRRSLFFSRADQLGDPFEGSYPKLNVKRRREAYCGTNLGTQDWSDLLQSMRGDTLVNCWCMGEHESDAMWKLYTRNEEGVTIQSTFRLLCEAFAETKQEVYAGTVAYVDYESDFIPEDNAFYPYLCKRKNFEHEKELRVIYQDLMSPDVVQYGLYIPVSISTLIERVHVAPFATDWFTDLVSSVARKYSADLEVVKSSLDAEPMY